MLFHLLQKVSQPQDALYCYSVHHRA
uniref:Uncharacterized protein n=1 Tax=Arundo donax TaxID=35708 RepID=A0A0A9C3Q1_ARUDO